MPTQAEKLAAVEAAVKTLAEIEAGQEAMQAQFDVLGGQIAECYRLGIGSQAQFLKINSGFTAAKGDVANALGKTIAAHEICTAAAKKADCDVVLPGAYAATGGEAARDGSR